LGHHKPPCDLLMLPDVTPVHKGLAPSGDSFLKELYLPFKAHTTASNYSDHCYLKVPAFYLLWAKGRAKRN